MIIVPGYGLAAAQAQHGVAELGKILEERGIEVSYAIHPVAGRMPGHMNVPAGRGERAYPQLKEMDEINPEFARADVALVIGRERRDQPGRPRPGNEISGMPILDVDQAKSIIVIKRSMGHGYAGLENELYFNPKTSMYFADAKKAMAGPDSAVKTLVGLTLASQRARKAALKAPGGERDNTASRRAAGIAWTEERRRSDGGKAS